MNNEIEHSSTEITPVITPETDPNPLPKPQSPFSRNIFNRLDIIEHEPVSTTSFNGGSKKRSGLKLALWTWFSASVDALVLISMCCFFMVVFSFMMKASSSSIVSLFIKNQGLANTMMIVAAVCIWSYFVFMRVFIGASIGEWTCDLRLGEPVQRFELSYLFRVMLRTTVILMTGIVVLPLLSLIVRRDLAGDISGIKIYSL